MTRPSLNPLQRLWVYTWWLFSRSRFDRELRSEMAFHVESRVDELVREGWSPADALAKARREFGSTARIGEDARAAWQIRWLDELAGDVRFALRTLYRSPAFLLTAVASLAIGIGATTAMLSAMNALLWRPLPVDDPQTLMRLEVTRQDGRIVDFLPQDLINRLRDSKAFVDIARYSSDGVSFVYDGRAERTVAEFVSPNYFGLLGVKPAIGRAFSFDVQQGHWAPEVVLSYRFWQQRFGGDPAAIGKTIWINTEPFTIVGVSAAAFSSLEKGRDPEFRLPILPDGRENVKIASISGAPTARWTAVARVAPDHTADRAVVAADAVFQQAVRSTPYEEIRRTGYLHVRAAAGGVSDASGVDPFRVPLVILLGLAAVVLLIAGANVATMAMARATARRQEMAVRVSIGAGRARLVRQLLVESLVLSAIGAGASIVVAVGATNVMQRFLPQGHVALVVDLHPDPWIFAATAALALLIGAAFGIVPALSATRGDVTGTLRPAAGGSLLDPRRAFGRRVLVAGQVAFALVLLIVAGLAVRALTALRPQEMSADPSRVLVLTIKPQRELYTDDRKRQLATALVERLRRIDGVQSVALAEAGPFASRVSSGSVKGPGGAVVEAGSDAVTSGFFETVGIARIAGRDFGPLDRPDVPLVAIINEALARQLAGGADQAIGLAFTINPTRPEPRVYHVIGVVADAHYYSVQGAPAPMFWASLIQEGPYMPTIHVRTPASDTAPVLAAVRRELDVLDSNFPVFNVRTLGARIDDALSQERLVADLAATFGGVALLLAMTGLYGVLAYSVAKRTREIGLRMALGSSPARVLWLVGREATQVVTVGGVAGLALGVAAARLFANSFSGVSAVDPVAFVIAAATMVIVAVVAGGLPALRAARVDPLVALRTE